MNGFKLTLSFVLVLNIFIRRKNVLNYGEIEYKPFFFIKFFIEAAFSNLQFRLHSFFHLLLCKTVFHIKRFKINSQLRPPDADVAHSTNHQHHPHMCTVSHALTNLPSTNFPASFEENFCSARVWQAEEMVIIKASSCRVCA